MLEQVLDISVQDEFWIQIVPSLLRNLDQFLRHWLIFRLCNFCIFRVHGRGGTLKNIEKDGGFVQTYVIKI